MPTTAVVVLPRSHLRCCLGMYSAQPIEWPSGALLRRVAALTESGRAGQPIPENIGGSCRCGLFPAPVNKCFVARFPRRCWQSAKNHLELGRC